MDLVLTRTLVIALALATPAHAENIAVAVAGDAAPELAAHLRGAVGRVAGATVPGDANALRAGSAKGRWVLVDVRKLSRTAVHYRARVGGPSGTFERGGIARPEALARRVISDVLMGLLLRARELAPRRVAVIVERTAPPEHALSAALRARGFELVPADELRAAQREVDTDDYKQLRELLAASAVLVLETVPRGRDRVLVIANVHDDGPARGVATSAPPKEATAAISTLVEQAPFARGVR